MKKFLFIFFIVVAVVCSLLSAIFKIQHYPGFTILQITAMCFGVASCFIKRSIKKKITDLDYFGKKEKGD